MLAKKLISGALVGCGADALFRLINRKKVLVLMYHAVTDRTYHPPPWTHLPVQRFREQLQFLKSRYQVISLEDLLAAGEGKLDLPPRAALITFDDGYRNNYRVAYPVLQELGLPATIFLTVDRIGSDQLLWLDELFLHLSASANQGRDLAFPDEEAGRAFAAGRLWEAYCHCAEALKRCGAEQRDRYLEKLRQTSEFQDAALLEDFRLLDWEEVGEMYRCGLVSYGVHSATHRILSELSEAEWAEEIAAPRAKLEGILGTRQRAFCFPNGRPGVDFFPEHLAYLEACGYRCCFTTRAGLFSPGKDDPLQVARIAAGNDSSSEPFYFRLNTSGLIPSLRSRFGAST